MKILEIRGATTVKSNDKNEILNESARLIKTIIDLNSLEIDDLVSMYFTMTNDLNVAYPSVAVREILNITDVAMLNFEEKYIEESLKKCIRVMIYINSDKNKSDINHVYLNEASILRPDLRK